MSENPKKKPKLSNNLSHSMIERKRREKIKECVEELRLLVPSCRGSKKFQKLQILQNAIRYIKENDQKWNGVHCVDCPSMIKNQIGMDKVKDEQEGDLNSDLENLAPKVENQNPLGLAKVQSNTIQTLPLSPGSSCPKRKAFRISDMLT